MKICPKCGNIVSYNTYFGAYICGGCNWEDRTAGNKRNKGICTAQYRLVREKEKATTRVYGAVRILACK